MNFIRSTIQFFPFPSLSQFSENIIWLWGFIWYSLKPNIILWTKCTLMCSFTYTFTILILWCVLLLGSRLWTCSSDSSVIYTRQKCDNWSRGLFRSIKEREEIVCTKGEDDLTHDVEISFNASTSDRTNLFRDFWKIRASFRG